MTNLAQLNMELQDLLQVYRQEKYTVESKKENQNGLNFCWISCKFSLGLDFPLCYPQYFGDYSFIMGPSIRSSMKNLEMRQFNLHEWLTTESLPESIILTTFSFCFITETIQKARTIVSRVPRLHHLHRMRTFNKTKWKTYDFFISSWLSGHPDKGPINRRELSLKLWSCLVRSGREMISRASQSCLCLASSSFLLAFCVQLIQGTDTQCFLWDLIVIFHDFIISFFNLSTGPFWSPMLDIQPNIYKFNFS